MLPASGPRRWDGRSAAAEAILDRIERG